MREKQQRVELNDFFVVMASDKKVAKKVAAALDKHINAYPVSNPARQNTMCANGDCFWEQCECDEHEHNPDKRNPQERGTK